MNKHTYVTVTATIFLVVAVLHLTRIVIGWEASMGGWAVPLWLSWGGLAVAGFLAYTGFCRLQCGGHCCRTEDDKHVESKPACDADASGN